MPPFLFCVLLLAPCTELVAQWEEVGDSIVPRAYRVYSIKIAKDRSIWLLSTQHNNPPRNIPEVRRSTDGGKSWNMSRPDVDSSAYAWDISPVDSQRAYIALDTTGLYRTTDGGKSWGRVRSYAYAANMVHFFNENEGIVFAGKNRLLKGQPHLTISLTKDGGKSWTSMGGENWVEPPGTSLPQRDTSEVYGYRFAINSSYDYSGNTIIVGMSNGNYWISTDRGYHWKRRSSPLTEDSIFISNVAMKDSTTFMLTGNYGRSLKASRGIATQTYTTRDGGNTWQKSTPNITAASSHYIPGSDSVFIITGHKDYHWGGGKGTIISYDYGKTWSFIDGTRLISIDFLEKDYGFATCCNTWAWPTTTGQVYKWNFQLPEREDELPAVYLFWLLPLALIASGYGWHRYRIHNLKKQSETRLQLNRLERAALQSQMNPHFLFNALNSLQSYINKNDTERSNEFIMHFSQLIRGTLSATDRNEITLEKEISLLTSYLELEKMRFSDRFDYFIYVSPNLDPKKIKIPTMLIQPILENAVLHGLPDIPEKGLIELKLRLKQPFLEISVTDNGKGIFRNKKEDINKNKSVGLQNVKQRLNIIHPKNQIKIEELKNAKGEVMGSKVQIRLYLQQKK